MLKAVNAREFDMVAAWSVDRLGRSLTDLLGILQGLHDKGVDLFLHQQGLDTSTTAGKAMFQMLGVFAEFERGIIRQLRREQGFIPAAAELLQACQKHRRRFRALGRTMELLTLARQNAEEVLTEERRQFEDAFGPE
jgi:Resolvase, N terminal domain